MYLTFFILTPHPKLLVATTTRIGQSNVVKVVITNSFFLGFVFEWKIPIIFFGSISEFFFDKNLFSSLYTKPAVSTERQKTTIFGALYPLTDKRFTIHWRHSMFSCFCTFFTSRKIFSLLLHVEMIFTDLDKLQLLFTRVWRSKSIVALRAKTGTFWRQADLSSPILLNVSRNGFEFLDDDWPL